MVRLTTRQLIKAFKENKYLLVRSVNTGSLYGINCKVMWSKNNQKHINNLKNRLDDETIYQSFKPCNLMEYITYKMPLKPS